MRHTREQMRKKAASLLLVLLTSAACALTAPAYAASSPKTKTKLDTTEENESDDAAEEVKEEIEAWSPHDAVQYLVPFLNSSTIPDFIRRYTELTQGYRTEAMLYRGCNDATGELMFPYTTDYCYNEELVLTKEVHYRLVWDLIPDENGDYAFEGKESVVDERSYFLDKNGLITSVLHREGTANETSDGIAEENPSIVISEQTDYTYGRDGLIQTETETSQIYDLLISSQKTFVHDTDGRLVSALVESEYGSEHHSVEYRYDYNEDGTLASFQTLDDSSGSSRILQYDFTYEDGLIASMYTSAEYEPAADDKVLVPDLRFFFTSYDEENRLISMYDSKDPGGIEYDHHWYEFKPADDAFISSCRSGNSHALPGAKRLADFAEVRVHTDNGIAVFNDIPACYEGSGALFVPEVKEFTYTFENGTELECRYDPFFRLQEYAVQKDADKKTNAVKKGNRSAVSKEELQRILLTARHACYNGLKDVDLTEESVPFETDVFSWIGEKMTDAFYEENLERYSLASKPSSGAHSETILYNDALSVYLDKDDVIVGITVNDCSCSADGLVVSQDIKAAIHLAKSNGWKFVNNFIDGENAAARFEKGNCCLFLETDLDRNARRHPDSEDIEDWFLFGRVNQVYCGKVFDR